MAFLKDEPARNSGNGNSQREDWKADGFLNLYLPDRSGELRKIGSIPLKKSRQNDARLIEFLARDPENAQKLLSRLQLQYNSAEVDEARELDLDF